MNDDQAVRDKQLLYSAKTFGGTIGRELLELIERKDEKSIAMLALLEQWVKQLPSPNMGRGTWESWEQQNVIDHTKQLLKEAKVE